MDVVRLDQDFKPDRLIEGWSSMIWTERYSTFGEFTMTTPMISESRQLIPEGTKISLLDSEEIMIVDTHSIDRDEQGGALNKITGSSFPVIIDDRDTIGRAINTSVYPNSWEMRRYYTPAHAVAVLLWNHLIDNAIPLAAPLEDLNGDPIVGPGDARLLIPKLKITATNIQVWTDPNPDYLDEENPDKWHVRKWVVDVGSLLKPVSDIMAQGKLGIRSRRPTSKMIQPISFAEEGILQVGGPQQTTDIAIDIYQGRDLSETVTFRYDAGQIEKPTYLYSNRGHKNIAHVASAQKELIVAAPGVDPNVGGLDRRILYFDVGNLADMDIEGNFTDSDWDRILTQKALTELEKYNKVALFDGEISPLNAVKYGKDYFLGDKVTLQAEYGLESTMMVSEYIRSQDENGETGYPTLSLVED